MHKLSLSIRALLLEAAQLFFTLVKVIVPIMLVIKIVQDLGWIEQLGYWLSPLMLLVDLPEVLGIVWVTTFLINLYAGAAVFIGLLPNVQLTQAEATVLWSMMLMSHAVPIEQRIAQKAGASFWATVLLRLVATIVYGAILSAIYKAGNWLQEPLELSWLPNLDAFTNPSWSEWLWLNSQSLLWLFLIIFSLLLCLKLFDALKINDLLAKLLAPLLRMMGISPQASTLTTFGALLGLTYGGALIIKEAKKDYLSRSDILLSLCFMSLCHSLIEDTLLALAFGADLTGVLIGRLFFSILVVALLALYLKPKLKY